MWRLNAEVIYSRLNGTILPSSPLSGSMPTPSAFDIDGLFMMYNATYGLADNSATVSTWGNATLTIRYYAIQQAKAFLQDDIAYNGASGDKEDNYWINYAMRTLIMVPYLVHTNLFY